MTQHATSAEPMVTVRRADLAALLDYDWQTEQRDFEQQHEDDREGHIFAVMQRLAAALEGS